MLNNSDLAGVSRHEDASSSGGGRRVEGVESEGDEGGTRHENRRKATRDGNIHDVQRAKYALLYSPGEGRIRRRRPERISDVEAARDCDGDAAEIGDRPDPLLLDRLGRVGDRDSSPPALASPFLPPSASFAVPPENIAYSKYIHQLKHSSIQ